MAKVQTDIGVRVGADVSPLERDLKKAGRSVQSFGAKTVKDMRAAASGIAKAFAASAAGAAAGLAVLMNKSFSAIDAQAKLAQRLNTTSASMAGLKRAGELAGVPMDAISASSRQLQVNLGRAQEAGSKQAETFKRLGLSASELSKIPLDQRISAINAALAQNIPQVERAAVAADIFGAKNALAMQALNPETIAEAGRQARIFGLALSEIDAARVENANDAFSTISNGIEGLQQQLSLKLAPLLERIGQEFLNVADEAGGMESVATNVFQNMITQAGFVLDAIDGIKRAFSIMADVAIIGYRNIVNAMVKVAIPLRAVLNGIAKVIEYTEKTQEEALAAEEKRLKSNRQAVRQSAQERIDAIKNGAFAEEKARRDSFIRMVDDLNNFSETTDDITQQAFENIHQTLMAPLPTTFLQKLVDDAQTASDAAAEAVVKGRQTIDGALGAGGAGATGGDPATDSGAFMGPEKPADWDATQQRIDWLRDSYKTELELLEEHNAAQIAEINKYNDARLIGDEEARALRISQAEAHQQAMAAIAERENAATVTGYADMWAQLASLGSTRSRKMFEVAKAVSIAQATIKGVEAAVSSYAFGARIGGPPLGAAFAAVSAATTAGMIQQIRGQSYQGTGGGAVNTGGAGATQAGATASAAPGPSQRPLEVRMTGLDANSLYSGSMVSTMFDKLREEAGDRGLRFVQ